MNEPFERIDDAEIEEFAEILKRLHKRNINDAGTKFIAQLIGMRRLVTSQHSANKQLLKSQEEGHLEMIEEQRTLVKWQKYATIATALMVLITGFYAFETHKIVDANVQMAVTAQEQLGLAKQQLREVRQPHLYVGMVNQIENVPLKSLRPGAFVPFRFQVENKSPAPAYNIRCELRLVSFKRSIIGMPGHCRDTLFTNSVEEPTFRIPVEDFLNLVAVNIRLGEIEMVVNYEDAPKKGKRFSATRQAQVVPSPGGFEIRSHSLEAN